MAEQSMEPAGAPRNRLMSRLRAEVVTKDDGRYLIYYSWPDEEAAEQAEQEAERRAAKERPRQQPWSPEAGPSDV